jgi:hypothetical protein
MDTITVVLSTTVLIVTPTYSNLTAAIAEYALAVARDTPTNGLSHLANLCLKFLIDIL